MKQRLRISFVLDVYGIPGEEVVVSPIGGCKTRPTDLQNALPRSSDPIGDWIDLMEVVEALCPKWPAAEAPRVGGVYRL
jgi:hypothetical protein